MYPSYFIFPGWWVIHWLTNFMIWHGNYRNRNTVYKMKLKNIIFVRLPPIMEKGDNNLQLTLFYPLITYFINKISNHQIALLMSNSRLITCVLMVCLSVAKIFRSLILSMYWLSVYRLLNLMIGVPVTQSHRCCFYCHI